MNPTPLSNNETLVLAVGMDAKKQAVFRMAFKMHRKTPYRLWEPGDLKQPQLAIVDIDNPEGAQLWERFRAEHPALPALLVSVNPLNNAPAPLLQKPIRMETLFPQLESLRDGNIVALPQTAALGIPIAQSVASSGNTASVAQIRPASVPDQQPDIPAPSAAPQTRPAPPPPRVGVEIRPDDIAYFDPRGGLLGLLYSLKRDRMPSTIITSAGQIVMTVNPADDEARLLMDEISLQAIVRDENTVFRARMPQPGDEATDTASKKTPMAALVWQIAIWAANGRLIKNVRLNTPVQLKYWPNLTRLAPIPNALRMAAFLTRSPVNPVLIVKLLQIPPRDVFNFLAATYCIDLLQLPQSAPVNGGIQGEADSMPVTATKPEPAPKQRGFLSRLLKKIAGL